MTTHNQSSFAVSSLGRLTPAARRAFAIGLPAAVLLTLLAGCATQGGSEDDRLGSMLVSPGQFGFYTCEQLAEKAKTTALRERELKGLMARAESGAGGGLVSALAYRPDYLQVHGEMNELRKSAAEKNCGALPPVAGAAAPRHG